MSDIRGRGYGNWGVAGILIASIAGCGQEQLDIACSIYFTENASSLTEQSPGIVLDSKTNLFWFRCNLGQSFRDGACVGAESNAPFEQTVASVASLSRADPNIVNTSSRGSRNAEELTFSALNWRIPTEAEYDSLTDVPCHSPKVDVTSFLDIKTDTYYWSSSEGKNDTYACATRLKDGLRTCQTKKTNRNPTLLVASAQ